MKVDIKIGEKVAEVELVERNDKFITMKIDGELLKVDAQNITPNLYSILFDNTSIDVEVQNGAKNKDYVINTMMQRLEATVIDAEAKYQILRGQGAGDDDENAIFVGPIINIPIIVKIGIIEPIIFFLLVLKFHKFQINIIGDKIIIPKYVNDLII